MLTATMTSRSSVCHSTGSRSLRLRLDLTHMKQNKGEKPSKGDREPIKNRQEEKVIEFKHTKEWLMSLIKKRRRRKANLGERERHGG